MIRKTLGVAALGVSLLGVPAVTTSAEASTTPNTATQAQAKYPRDCWRYGNCDNYGFRHHHYRYWNHHWWGPRYNWHYGWRHHHYRGW